jgi:hypothetical protein
MPFRFYRRKQMIPDVRVNLSRSGPSLTFGVRGAHVTVGERGVTRTVGIPGTGLFYARLVITQGRTGRRIEAAESADVRGP